ncbi:DUF7507 domain-containing protein, partial [Microbulbifer sp.]|uniref:DUF7507 domain-containing protein n=1 Tax=Microbulbifer sp. TaxID=1908541 RepID=UPI003F2E838A
DNTATANATDPGGNPVSANDSTSTALTASPALDLSKVAGAPSGNSAGDTIAYTFTVTNTGNVTIDGIAINDPQLDAVATCDTTTLAPGAIATCSGTHTITQAEVDAGTVDNTATASGTDPGSNPVSANDSTSTALSASPALSLDKSAADSGYAAVGDTINYSYLVTNTGNVTVGDIAVSDDKIPSVDCPATVLAPGQSTTCTGSYTVTQADLDAGSVTNLASASGVPAGGTLTPAEDSETVAAAPNEIAAADDSYGPVNGADGAADLGSVFDNDTLDGGPLDPVDVTATPLDTLPAELSFDPATGSVGLAPGAPAGDYGFTYRICEETNTSNCSTAVVTVSVVAPEIQTADDDFSVFPINGANGGTTPLILANDTLNGDAMALSAVELTALEIPAGLTLNPDSSITVAPGTAAGSYAVRYRSCEIANPDNCDTATVTVLVVAPEIVAVDDDFSGTTINGAEGGGLPSVLGNDTLNGIAIDPAVVELTAEEVPAGLGFNPDGSLAVAPATAGGTYAIDYRICERLNPDNCDTARVVLLVEDGMPLRLRKSVATQQVRVGDLIRYELVAENVSEGTVQGVALVDTPPPGFSLVADSLRLRGAGGQAVLADGDPIRIEGIRLAAGASLTATYLLRVGPGVVRGEFVNSAVVERNGNAISNTARASVYLVADPLLEETRIFGTVFDDRDGDGWQDSARATGLQLRGGFAPRAYVPGSTTIDRGDGPRPVPDASAPLLRGLDLGELRGRASESRGEGRRIVVAQRLRAAEFTSDLVLRSAEGSELHMGAGGEVRVAAAKPGDSAQDLRIRRRVSPAAGGDYLVEYEIRNEGVDEAGLPGVRLATIEGLIVETDAYGRYHLEGIDVANFARGRNFVVKVDPASLPSGSVPTTRNPLIKRVTQGVPVRFDFGVHAPGQPLEAPAEIVEMAVGEVLFEPGSAHIDPRHRPAIEEMAARVRDYRGGELVITGHAEAGGLALERAQSLREALLAELPSELRDRVGVELRTHVDAEMLARLDGGVKLGTLLFDTDSAEVRPGYRELIRAVARRIEARGGGWVTIVGHTDRRASAEYNRRLGLRRARAVYDAIAAELDPETRERLRVEVDEGREFADREVQL